MTWRVAPHPARRDCLTIQDDGEQYLALYVQPEVAELMAKAPELLRYLLAQYDRLLNVHARVVMDTPEDRELHDLACAAFTDAADPVRAALATEVQS